MNLEKNKTDFIEPYGKTSEHNMLLEANMCF